jgi:hypothetical protein
LTWGKIVLIVTNDVGIVGTGRKVLDGIDVLDRA